MVRLLVVTALVSLGVAHVAAAQSLGDVAKKEEQRRKTVKSTGKVYTNDQLKPDPQPSVPAGSATGTRRPLRRARPRRLPRPPSRASADKGDEKSWRKRIADARDALQRSQTFADALQSQLNCAHDRLRESGRPGSATAIANNRDRVTAELERVKKEVAAQTKAISDIQEEARRAGVPAGWVR